MTREQFQNIKKGMQIEYDGVGWHFKATVKEKTFTGNIIFTNIKPFKDQRKTYYREDGFRSYNSMTILAYEPFQNSTEIIKGKNKKCLQISCTKLDR